MKEYERKYIIINPEEVKEKLKGKEATEYERYYTYIGKDGQVRISKKGDKYAIESAFGDYRGKVRITEEAFKQMTRNCIKVIKRTNYQLSDEIKIKEYDGEYKGLFIVDVEFPNSEAYYSFKKPDWLGPEVTLTKLGKDGTIIQLSREEVLDLIDSLQRDNNKEQEL